MPITVTFDLEKPKANDLNRIRGVFERLGWEHLGNTAYRYPKLHSQHHTEDWFNHVIPALMMLRAFALHAPNAGFTVTKFSIDVQSSTGYNPETGVGSLPFDGDHITFSSPSDAGKAFGKKNLKKWLDNIEWAYKKDEEGDDGDD
jgi:hypothetical protein